MREQTAREEQFEVWPENWSVFKLFVGLETQWNVTAGGFIGLRYEGVEAMLRMSGVKKVRSVFERLQVMEQAALKVLNDRS